MAQLSDEQKLEKTDFSFDLFNSTYLQVSNKNIVKRINGSDGNWRSAFGSFVIDINDGGDSKIFKNVTWKIKINNATDKYIMIGVCRDVWNADGNGSYALQHGYMYYGHNGHKYNNGSNSSYAKAINGNNSIVLMNLNITDKALSFNVDGEDAGVAFSNLPNGKYRLVIDIYHNNDEAEVLSQNIEYDNALADIVNDLDQIQTILGKLNMKINKQEQASTLNIGKLLQEGQYIGQVEEKGKALNQEFENLNINIENYKKKVNSTLHPDTENYRNWNSEDIVKWVITLDNGVYNKYSNKLLQSLKENKVKGGNLANITKNDLLSFGVDAFIHRESLFKHIKQLTKQDKSETTGAKQSTKQVKQSKSGTTGAKQLTKQVKQDRSENETADPKQLTKQVKQDRPENETADPKQLAKQLKQDKPETADPKQLTKQLKQDRTENETTDTKQLTKQDRSENETADARF